MSRFYIQFTPDGKGRATGWVAEEDWNAHIAAHPDFGHVQIGLEKFREVTGRAHEHRFDFEMGVVPKARAVMHANKTRFAGDGKDRVTITWTNPASPVDVRINGLPLTNNPHIGGFVLTWDQAQKLRVEIDDAEWIGAIEVEAT